MVKMHKISVILLNKIELQCVTYIIHENIFLDISFYGNIWFWFLDISIWLFYKYLVLLNLICYLSNNYFSYKIFLINVTY